MVWRPGCSTPADYKRYKVDTDFIQTYTARSVDSAEMEKRSTMEELMEVLSALKPEIDFTQETELIDDGLLESFDVITLIAELEARIRRTPVLVMVEIPAEEIVPENFNSAEGIWKLLERIKEEA